MYMRTCESTHARTHARARAQKRTSRTGSTARGHGQGLPKVLGQEQGAEGQERQEHADQAQCSCMRVFVCVFLRVNTCVYIYTYMHIFVSHGILGRNENVLHIGIYIHPHAYSHIHTYLAAHPAARLCECVHAPLAPAHTPRTGNQCTGSAGACGVRGCQPLASMPPHA